MNDSRHRLLFVTSRYPYPAIGGDRLRVFHHLRLLAREFDVELLTLGPERVDVARVDALRSLTGVSAVTVIEQPRWRALWGALRALLAGRPLQVGYFHNATFERTYEGCLARADVVLMHLVRTSGMWHRQSPIPSMLDMVDAISENLAQVGRYGPRWGAWTWIARLEEPRMRRYEREQASLFDQVSFVAAGDREAVGLRDEASFVLTMGVDLAAYPYTAPSRRTGHSIALIGKMDTYPNRSAALWAARELLPRLPGMRLKVIGDCSPALRGWLTAFPNVEVTGRVDSIAQACSDCFASIAPLEVATGIQNKALESFALGLPLVASASVARGLLPQSAGSCLLAGGAPEWADALLRLAADRGVADTMAERARRYVDQHHDWDQVGRLLAIRLKALVSNPSPTPSTPLPAPSAH
jgi:glycosyltransferase involved in cell wall biosynthesis